MDIARYFRIWWTLTLKSTQVAFSSRFGAALFILGKIIRFFLVLSLIILIASRTKVIAGYSLWQMILFYATFNLVDTLTQFLLREVYRFRYYVVSGDFDYFLTKPFSPLLKSLFGGCDVLDLPMIVFSVVLLVIAITHLGPISLFGVLSYLILVLSSLTIALAFHIIVLSMGILTTEVDNTIMLYRDLTQIGRFPVDIYRAPISWIITFILPIGIMMTYPAKALMGILSFYGMIISIAVSSIFLIFSLKFWQFSIKRYSSASS